MFLGLGGLFLWVLIAILIGVWASRLGMNGFFWGALAIIISPLIAFICLLISNTNPKVNAVEMVKENSENSENSTANQDWVILKKYIPEISAAIKYLSNDITSKNMDLAENKLQELFFVIGKDGLTENSLDIIISDVFTELEEIAIAIAIATAKNKSAPKSVVNLDLIKGLKGIKSVGFNEKFAECEICYSRSTGQTISEHYVCSNCKSKYL